MLSHEKRLERLIYLTSGKTMRPFSGNTKKFYKYLICGLFVNLIGGQDLTFVQDDIYRKISFILRTYKTSKVSDEGLDEIRRMVQESMRNAFFHEPINDDTTTKVVEVLRNVLADIKRGKTLFQVHEFNDILDIKKLCESRGAKVLDHHWVEFNLDHGFVHTVPVLIILGDLKIHWNSYVEKVKLLREEQDKHFSSTEQRLEFEKREDIRELRHTISGLFRTLLFTSVTFVESYLYELFFNMKNLEFTGKDTVKVVLDNKRINDTEIVERIIFGLYPNTKEKLNKIYREYKVIVNERDRYVHASSFRDESNNLSMLQYLLKHDNVSVVNALNTCVKFVKEIESSLPSELQFLYWWDRFEEPNFSLEQKISLLNPNASVGKLEYFNHK